MEGSYTNGEVWIEGGSVVGFYNGDDNNPSGDYILYHLGTPSYGNFARISWEDSTFVLNVPSGYTETEFEDHPVINVTWYGAMVFAKYYGCRLPTEMEWEKAARGLTGYEYPWGNIISGDKANYWDSEDPWDNGTTPVGYYNGENGTTESASYYECYDMCGNVSEWIDIRYINSSQVRGGNWLDDSDDSDLLSWSSSESYYQYASDNCVGFRCARAGCGLVTDTDGYEYETVQIGDQCWMAENLKVTHYRNGDPIPLLTSDEDWANTSNGAYCIYNNTTANAETYGNLYNWFAVNDPRGLAPEGWHIPTDEEIIQLEMHLGMTSSHAYGEGWWRGTNEGSKLAGIADLWNFGDLASDPEFETSGLKIIPAGYRIEEERIVFYGLNTGCTIWSSSESTEDRAWIRSIKYNHTEVYRDYYLKNSGHSVRCVRD